MRNLILIYEVSVNKTSRIKLVASLYLVKIKDPTPVSFIVLTDNAVSESLNFIYLQSQ